MDDRTSFTAECARCWEQNERLVNWVVWRVVRTYGGDYEELMSEALVHFTEAIRRFDPEQGSVSNWIQFYVYRSLIETRRNRARHLAITGPITEIKPSVRHREDKFQNLWNDLSPDTQIILLVLFDLDLSEYRNTSLMRMFLRRKVREKHSIPNEKITECFAEISAALG